MSAPTSTEVDRLASLPKPSPSPEGRIWLRDLPLPPELLPIIWEYCKPFWFWERARFRRSIENELKLQYYFGGHYVEYLATPEGYVIVSMDDMSEGGFHKLRDQLPAEERDQLRGEPVSRWGEERLPSVYEGL